MPADLNHLRIPRGDETPPSRGGRRTPIIFGLGGAVLLILAALYVWGPLSPAPEVSLTAVAKVYPGQAYSVLYASGYVVAQRKAAVSSKSTGRLAFLGVEEGSRVKKGQIIASLENSDLAAARDQAVQNLQQSIAALGDSQAELEDSRRTSNRYKDLLARDLVAKQDYDVAFTRYQKAVAGVATAQARIRASKAAAAEAEASLEYTYIRSPFDGVVLTKYAEVGEVVAPFGAAVNARAAVVTMADFTSLMVEADVAEPNLGQVRQGQPCEITLDAIPDKRFPGEVHMVVPTADRTKATILTKIRFLEMDERVLPEMSAKVSYLSRPLGADEQVARLAVPKGALISRQDKTWAFLLQGRRVELVQVATGPAMRDMVEVTGGLKEGDRVVLNPPASLGNNSRVKVKE